MNILCLEQGGWMNPAEYPGMRRTGRRASSATSRSARTRAAGARTTRQRLELADPGLELQRRRRQHDPLRGALPALPSVRLPRETLDGVADDWPIDYATLEPYYDVNAHMMGVSGLAGDPAYPPKSVPLPPVTLGKLGETLARGFNELGWHWWPSDSADHDGRARGSRAVHQRGHLSPRLRAGREGVDRHHVLARRDPEGRAA
jgi:choline dehydrogenase-like flavoprotein